MKIGRALEILVAEFRKLGYEGDVKLGAGIDSDLPHTAADVILREPPGGSFKVWPDGRIEDEDGVLARIGKERAGLC